MSSWSFSRRRGQCTACERDFTDGEPHYSALSIEGEELVRGDLCRPCWKAREDEREGLLFWWRTRHEAGRSKGLALNLEAIEGLFLGLEGRAEQRLRELRYVLCLLLMRKRRLKIERIERSADGEAMLVRRPRRKEALRVFVFDFDAERMAQLREELRRVFDSDEGLTAVAAGATEGPSVEADPREDGGDEDAPPDG
jgi:hypothetical protein